VLARAAPRAVGRRERGRDRIARRCWRERAASNAVGCARAAARAVVLARRDSGAAQAGIGGAARERIGRPQPEGASGNGLAAGKSGGAGPRSDRSARRRGAARPGRCLAASGSGGAGGEEGPSGRRRRIGRRSRGAIGPRPQAGSGGRRERRRRVGRVLKRGGGGAGSRRIRQGVGSVGWRVGAGGLGSGTFVWRKRRRPGSAELARERFGLTARRIPRRRTASSGGPAAGCRAESFWLRCIVARVGAGRKWKDRQAPGSPDQARGPAKRRVQAEPARGREPVHLAPAISPSGPSSGFGRACGSRRGAGRRAVSTGSAGSGGSACVRERIRRRGPESVRNRASSGIGWAQRNRSASAPVDVGRCWKNNINILEHRCQAPVGPVGRPGGRSGAMPSRTSCDRRSGRRVVSKPAVQPATNIGVGASSGGGVGGGAASFGDCPGSAKHPGDPRGTGAVGAPRASFLTQSGCRSIWRRTGCRSGSSNAGSGK